MDSKIHCYVHEQRLGSICRAAPHRHSNTQGWAGYMTVPKRWQYPQSEYYYNPRNVKDAVAAQYGGDDDINKVMWLIQWSPNILLQHFFYEMILNNQQNCIATTPLSKYLGNPNPL
jgi:hypothetical protein